MCFDESVHVLIPCLSQALASYAKCLELCPDARNAGQNLLLALNYRHQGVVTFVVILLGCGSGLELWVGEQACGILKHASLSLLCLQ